MSDDDPSAPFGVRVREMQRLKVAESEQRRLTEARARLDEDANADAKRLVDEVKSIVMEEAGAPNVRETYIFPQADKQQCSLAKELLKLERLRVWENEHHEDGLCWNISW